MYLIPRFKRLGINSKFRPYPTNPLYKKKLAYAKRVNCEICKRHDTHTKYYKSLWSLYLHFTAQHPLESADFIINYARKLAKEGENR
jgi:hypothetical protein